MINFILGMMLGSIIGVFTIAIFIGSKKQNQKGVNMNEEHLKETLERLERRINNHAQEIDKLKILCTNLPSILPSKC